MGESLLFQTVGGNLPLPLPLHQIVVRSVRRSRQSTVDGRKIKNKNKNIKNKIIIIK